MENKVGRLVEITDTIAKAGIDIRAVSLADTSDYGILRVIVDNPDQAEKVISGCRLYSSNYQRACSGNPG